MREMILVLVVAGVFAAAFAWALVLLARAKEKAFADAVRALQEQFAGLAAERLNASAAGLTAANERQMSAVVRPLQEQLETFRRAFEAERSQQIANRASFDRAIADLGQRALKIGEEAETLARALKRESKTQGDWGEMVLSNILTTAGLREGRDFVTQAQEFDAGGNRLVPDVEIPLPNGEKLLVDSKCSLTAYLDYTAARDDAARDRAAKEHVASVRAHVEELAGKDYIKRVKGSQGYILMFIPNEGSHLLAMERDSRLALDAFRSHVLIVNPTTLLLCLQIVSLLRAREAQNENAEKVARAAAKLYEKFAGFSDTFADIGHRLEMLEAAYGKASGQLCAGPGNVVRQLEALKEMGVVSAKRINAKVAAQAGADGEDT